MAPDFKIIDTPVSGTVTIAVNTQINYLNADEVVVKENVRARLYGNVHKSLTLKKGSYVIFHGAICGEVKNEGGELNHFAKKCEG